MQFKYMNFDKGAALKSEPASNPVPPTEDKIGEEGSTEDPEGDISTEESSFKSEEDNSSDYVKPTNISELGKNTLSEDIVAILGKKLENAKNPNGLHAPVVYAQWAGKTAGYTVLGVMQLKPLKTARSFFFSDFGNQAVRATITIPTSNASKFKAGTVLTRKNDYFTIVTIESFEPAYDEQSAVINPSDGIEVERFDVLTGELAPIYRSTEVYLGSEGFDDITLPLNAPEGFEYQEDMGEEESPIID